MQEASRLPNKNPRADQNLRVKAHAAATVLAYALTSGHLGAKGLGVVMEAVDEGGKERRLLQSAGRIRQSESDRADRREDGLVPSSATNEWSSRLPVQSSSQFVANQVDNQHSGHQFKIARQKIETNSSLPSSHPRAFHYFIYFSKNFLASDIINLDRARYC